MEKNEKNKCLFCKEDVGKYGNSPEPIFSYEKGKACNDCNVLRVIPARLSQIASGELNGK